MTDAIAPDPLKRFLERRGVLILDGGLATELEARGHQLDPSLWSAKLLLDAPEAIHRLHLDYLAAGADCIVAATYQATLPGFMAAGLSGDEAETLLRAAVLLARRARDEFWSRSANRENRLRPLVAASVGPYGAYLADGSEYTGDYDLDEAGLEEFHRDRLTILADAGADLLACETIPSAAEARALVRLLEAGTAPAWVSFSCRDGERICDGGEFAAAAAAAATSPAVLAVGVNCTAPRYLDELIGRLAGRIDKPIVVYPNSGEGYDAARRRWTPAPEALDLAAAAPRWVERGASVVGGCCRTGPNDVRRLKAALQLLRED